MEGNSRDTNFTVIIHGGMETNPENAATKYGMRQYKINSDEIALMLKFVPMLIFILSACTSQHTNISREIRVAAK